MVADRELKERGVSLRTELAAFPVRLRQNASIMHARDFMLPAALLLCWQRVGARGCCRPVTALWLAAKRGSPLAGLFCRPYRRWTARPWRPTAVLICVRQRRSGVALG